MHFISTLGGGGAERQLSYLVPALVDLDIDVHVASVAGGVNMKPITDSGCSVHRLPATGNYSFRLARSVTAKIVDVKPSLVQTWLLQMDVLAGIAAIRQKTPFLLTERNSAPAYDLGLKGVIRRWVGGRAAGVIANSMQGLAMWEKSGSSQVLRCVPNALPLDSLDRFREQRAKRDSGPETAAVVLFAGRFVEAKNVELTLQAVLESARLNNRVQGRFFGEGPLAENLRHTAESSGFRERVRILDYTDDLWREIAGAAVLVSLSHFEGQPNVALEAAAIGCPLILSDIEAHREIFDEESAWFVARNDATGAARSIQSVIDRPEEARKKAAAARRKVMGRSAKDCAKLYRDVYEEVLAKTS